jgi:hypothetical protein
MAEDYEIQKGIPAPPVSKQKTGMTQKLRQMEHMDCMVVPNSKRGSVYACAAQAGIKIQTQSNPDGRSITVWRISEDTEDTKDTDASPDSSVSGDMLYVLTPDGGLPTGHYEQPHPYGPNIWINDVDALGRPENRNKKAKQPGDIFS